MSPKRKQPPTPICNVLQPTDLGKQLKLRLALNRFCQAITRALDADRDESPAQNKRLAEASIAVTVAIAQTIAFTLKWTEDPIDDLT